MDVKALWDGDFENWLYGYSQYVRSKMVAGSSLLSVLDTLIFMIGDIADAHFPGRDTMALLKDRVVADLAAYANSTAAFEKFHDGLMKKGTP